MMIAVLVTLQALTVIAVLHAASEAHHCHHGFLACPPDCEHHQPGAKESETSFTQCRNKAATILIPQVSNAVLALPQQAFTSDMRAFVSDPLLRQLPGHRTDIFRPPGLT